ncbi:PIN domain-containing protein [Kribbella catacumbae]|uniref:PIN domain-containing protein n=1 Tax=Kribbella catacumbae TaxID=460086 RepID=UPI0009FCB11B
MLVVPDANVLMADPLCRGIAWKIVAHAPSRWNLRVFVLEAIVREAVAGHARSVVEGQAALRRWSRKFHQDRIYRDALPRLAQAEEGYEQQLRLALEQLGATIAQPADIPHLQIIDRAINRRRPCDAKGDGYRDTLNWLTVLDLAQRHPHEKVVWVSNDRDFTDNDITVLHPHLIEDLDERGLQGRVLLANTLANVVLATAAENFSQPVTNLRDLLEQVEYETVVELVLSEIAGEALGAHVDPASCALPLASYDAVLTGFVPPAAFVSLEVKGSDADGQAIAEFAVTMLCKVTFASGVPPRDDEIYEGPFTTSSITKPLVIRGLVTLGASYRRPDGVEAISVTAPPNDPGHAAWQLVDFSSGAQAVTEVVTKDWRQRLQSRGLAELDSQVLQAAVAELAEPMWQRFQADSLAEPPQHDQEPETRSS